MITLRHDFLQDEENNELNEREEKEYVPFDIILNKQKQLEDEFNAIKNKATIDA